MSIDQQNPTIDFIPSSGYRARSQAGGYRYSKPMLN